MRAYYDQRAAEYDETSWLAHGVETEEATQLGTALAALPPAKILDVAIGTGYISRYLRGDVVGLDASAGMLQQARRRLPNANFMLSDALKIPFADQSFDRVFTAHFYGHLEPSERTGFLDEAFRVAPELVIVDSLAESPWEGWQERPLVDGGEVRIWKRYFGEQELAGEVGGEVFFAGSTFVGVRSIRTG